MKKLLLPLLSVASLFVTGQALALDSSHPLHPLFPLKIASELTQKVVNGRLNVGVQYQVPAYRHGAYRHGYYRNEHQQRHPHSRHGHAAVNIHTYQPSHCNHASHQPQHSGGGHYYEPQQQHQHANQHGHQYYQPSSYSASQPHHQSTYVQHHTPPRQPAPHYLKKPNKHAVTDNRKAYNVCLYTDKPKHCAKAQQVAKKQRRHAFKSGH